MNASNKFNIETIKSFARTTNANRVKAVQMICSGGDEQQCKENALAAYSGCIDDGLLGIDRGTLELFKHLANMPIHVWTNFKSAGDESAEGEKLAAKLVKLSQAIALCKQYICSYDEGYKEGYIVGYNEGYDDAHKKAEEKDSVEDNVEDSVEDSDASKA